MARKPQTIETLEELQRLVPSIVKAVNADQQLATRALANPLLALEELGYRLSEDLRPVAERRARFSLDKAERLEALAADVYKLADQRFDIDSPKELAHVLFEKLKLPRIEPAAAEHAKRVSTAAVEALPTLPLAPPLFRRPALPDPLEKLRGLHPVVAPLLEYRRLESSEPRLAPRELYERIRRGEVKLPVTRVRARLQRDPTPE